MSSAYFNCQQSNDSLYSKIALSKIYFYLALTYENVNTLFWHNISAQNK